MSETWFPWYSYMDPSMMFWVIANSFGEVARAYTKQVADRIIADHNAAEQARVYREALERIAHIHDEYSGACIEVQTHQIAREALSQASPAAP